jgi:hypothetical protein
MKLGPCFNQLQELVYRQDLTVIIISWCPNILCNYCHHGGSQDNKNQQDN